MKRLMNAKEIAERYQCSERTAMRYMRKMVHMEKPLRVTEQAVEAWEAERMRVPEIPAETRNAKRQTLHRMQPTNGQFIIPRVRPNYAGK